MITAIIVLICLALLIIIGLGLIAGLGVILLPVLAVVADVGIFVAVIWGIAWIIKKIFGKKEKKSE